jgi:AcrR family transcriptional regulator
VIARSATVLGSKISRGPTLKARTSFHHGDTKQAAVLAALAIVAEHGQQALTLRSVAERIGINHRALYRQYASREALLDAVAADGFDGLATRVEKRLASSKSNGAAALAETYARFALAEPHLYEVMFSRPLPHSMTDPTGVGPPLRRLVSAAAELVQIGCDVALGADKTKTAVLRLWGMVHGLVGLYRVGALDVRSDRGAVRFIVDAAQAQAAAGVERS